MSRTTNDPKALSREDRIKAAKKYRSRQDLLWVLGDERGRRCLQEIIEEAGIYKLIPVGSAQVHVSLGHREIGLNLRQSIKNLRPELPPQMETEYAALPDLPGKGPDDESGDGSPKLASAETEDLPS